MLAMFSVLALLLAAMSIVRRFSTRVRFLAAVEYLLDPCFRRIDNKRHYRDDQNQPKTDQDKNQHLFLFSLVLPLQIRRWLRIRSTARLRSRANCGCCRSTLSRCGELASICYLELISVLKRAMLSSRQEPLSTVDRQR